VSFDAGLTCDNDDNMTFFYKPMKNPIGFAYYTLRPVSFNRVSAAFRYGDPDFIGIFFAGVF
jgi:hypothetical protein